MLVCVSSEMDFTLSMYHFGNQKRKYIKLSMLENVCMYVPALPHLLHPGGHSFSWPLTRDEVGTSQFLGCTHQPTSHSAHLSPSQKVEGSRWAPQLLAHLPPSLRLSAAVEGGHDSSQQGQLLSLTL